MAYNQYLWRIEQLRKKETEAETKKLRGQTETVMILDEPIELPSKHLTVEPLTEDILDILEVPMNEKEAEVPLPEIVEEVIPVTEEPGIIFQAPVEQDTVESTTSIPVESPIAKKGKKK